MADKESNEELEMSTLVENETELNLPPDVLGSYRKSFNRGK